jgi:hypothetical protein
LFSTARKYENFSVTRNFFPPTDSFSSGNFVMKNNLNI